MSSLDQDSSEFSPEPSDEGCNYTDQEIRELEASFKSLADVNRLPIFILLKQRFQPFRSLQERTGLSQPALSNQLAHLRVNGFVTAKTDGRNHTYFKSDMKDPLGDAVKLIVELAKDDRWKIEPKPLEE